MQHSLLSNWLADSYPLSRSITCQLLRAYTNDVYEVRSGQERFVLKIYGSNWRTEAEIRYEVALLHHLASRGLRIACPIAGHDHDFVRQMKTEEGNRDAVLYEYAEGEKPQPPFSTRLYESFGRSIAQMHTLSEDFVTVHQRRNLDLDYLVDDALNFSVPYITRSEDREFLLEFASQIKNKIAEFASSSLDWGAIHGDASLDNLHVTAAGDIVLYDFDSGGPGWRASDIQGWAIHNAGYEEKGAAFRRGYSQVRSLQESDILAAPFLTMAWEIWGIRVDLERRVLQQGRDATERYLRQQRARLVERQQALP